jgi:hypothetical protein
MIYDIIRVYFKIHMVLYPLRELPKFKLDFEYGSHFGFMASSHSLELGAPIAYFVIRRFSIQ